MLAKIFGSKKEINDPVHRIWVKWFTVDLPKQSHLQVIPQDILTYYQQIQLVTYTKQQVFKNREPDDLTYFTNLFKLNEPLDEKVENLINYINTSTSVLMQSERLLQLLVPPIYQYLIRYLYQFPTMLNLARSDNVATLQFIQKAYPLLNFYMSHSNKLFEDALFLLKSFYERLSSLLNDGIFIQEFFPEVLNITLNFLTGLQEDNSNTFSMFQFLLNYYHMWISKIHTPQFTKENLTDCIKICDGMSKIKPAFAIHYKESLIDPILSNGFNMLSFLFILTNNPVDDMDIAYLGISFLRFLDFYTNLGPDFAETIFCHQMLHFIGAFIMWTLDRFPICDDQAEPEKVCETDLEFYKHHIFTPPEFKFVKKVLHITLTKSHNRESFENRELIMQYALTEISERIQKIPQLKSVFVTLANLTFHTNSYHLVELLYLTIMDFVTQLMNGTSIQYNFRSEPRLLCSSAIFFITQLFLHSQIQIVVQVLQDHNGFTNLANTFIFSPKFNTWETDNTCIDNIFITETRLSVYSLFASSYANIDSSYVPILNALSTLFGSSAPIIDEVIQFIYVLFCTSTEIFTQILPKVNLIQEASQYMVDLQRINIDMEEQNYEQKKISMLEQSRYHIFNIFDYFSAKPGSRLLIFSEKLFCDSIIHFFFEDATQNYAIDMWENGLLIDQGYITNVFDPFLHMFDLQNILFDNSFNHVDDEDWISLIYRLLQTLDKVIPLNKKTLINYITNYNLLENISNLPNISTDVSKKLEFVNLILHIFFLVIQGSPVIRKSASKKPMENMSEILSKLDYGDETVKLLLSLIFERSMDLKNLPRNMDINNAKIIPAIHRSTKHLYAHDIIFNYLSKVCTSSVTNKLKLFMSKTPLVILKYIQSFDNFPSPNKDGSYAPTVNWMLILFSTVSSAVFKWKTFYEALRSMRPYEKTKRWWTVQLISTFSTILSEISSRPPSSFFHFHGRRTGIDLPVLPAGVLTNGFTFVVRLELGSIISLDGNRATLLSLLDTSGNSMDLFFEDNHLVFEYYKGKDNIQRVVISRMKRDVQTPLEFSQNVWSRIIFTINEKKCATLWIDKVCYHEFVVKGFKLDQEIKQGKIACNSPKMYRPTEDPLIANISSIYLFDRCLSQENIQRIASLPNDYCFGFSPSQASAFPDVPKELFTDEINNSLILCLNARMTAGTTCANFTTRGIGNAEVRGQIIPFSTSFIDVTTNMGGLNVFLPLLEQVDYPIKNEEINDATNFLLSLLGLFNQFLNNSDVIQHDFFASEGMKSLAFLLSKINPTTMHSRVISQLCEMFNSIKTEENKLVMIRDIFLNFSLWANHLPDTQICVIDHSWKYIFSSNIDLFTKSTSVTNLIITITDQPNASIRNAFWELVQNLAPHKFTSSDQTSLFELAMMDNPIDVSLEILKNTYILMKKQVNNFHRIVEKYKYYLPFTQYLSISANENVRIFSLKFICQIYKQQLRGQMSTAGTEDPDTMFINAILAMIAVYNPNESTLKMLEIVTKIFFRSKKMQPGLFPFIIYLSTIYKPEEFRPFFEKCQTVEVCSSISQAPCWLLWLFYAMFQTNRPKLVFGSDTLIDSIIAMTLIQITQKNQNNNDKNREQSAVSSMISLFMHVMIFNKFDTTPLIRNVLKIMLRKVMQEISKWSSDQLQNIITPIVRFIFFPENSEIYKDNVQLLQMANVEVKGYLASEAQGHIALSIYKQIFSKDKVKDVHTTFSLRVENNKWLDSELAKMLLDIMCFLKDKEISEMKMKVSEVTSLIAATLIHTDHSNTLNYIQSIKSIISNDYSALAIVAESVYRVSIKYDKTLFNSFIKTYPEIISRIPRKPQDGNSYLNDQYFVTDIFNELFKDIRIYNMMADDSDKVSTAITRNLTFYIESCAPTLMKLDPEQAVLFETIGYKRRHLEFTNEMKIQKYSCEKAWRRIWRNLSTNGSPWSSIGNAQHWKLAQRWDSLYRRFFMKPNLEFDPHVKASFRRDATSESQAQELFLNWQKNHPEQTIEQDTNQNEDIDEDINTNKQHYSLSLNARMITLEKNYEGIFFMNDKEIAFNATDEQRSIQFEITQLDMVLHRSYLHIDSGLEFFLKSRRSYFIMFGKQSDRRNVIQYLRPYSNQMVLQIGNIQSLYAFQEATNQWKSGNMSNFEYLMKINFFAGRSYNDLSQYPVFPWVLKDYKSPTLDLNNPDIYRDLSKPIGALNEQRLAKSLNEYQECPDGPERCLYRMHYSNAFYVLNYLVRMEPYTTLHIEVNDRKFDKSNRMFSGIKRAWNAVVSHAPDYRELIPEFFCCPDFLTNHNNFDLGKFKNGCENGDVKLPKWAKSPAQFIAIHRAALESPYVTSHLGQWIDLIFGYKQQGQAAIDANNTFHAYCYSSSVTPEIIRNRPDDLQTIQFTAGNVGIIPRQLFTSPHPCIDVKLRRPINSTKFIKEMNGRPSFVAYNNQSKSMFCLMQNAQVFLVNSTSPPNMIGSIQGTTIMDGTGQKSFAYFPDSQRFIVSSPWDSCFHVFKAESNSLTQIHTERQKFSLIVALQTIGKSFLLTIWRDSSISVYSIIDKYSLLYRITPHFVSIVDADASLVLDIIVSADKDSNIVISRLVNGAFIRKLTADDQIQKVSLIEDGYIAVCTGTNHTKLTLYTVNGDFVASTTFTAKMTAWTNVTDSKTSLSHIIIAFDNFEVVEFNVPQLEILSSINAGDTLSSLTYDPNLNAVFGAASDGICFLNF
ncbi:Beige/BEACH domain containing protein [Trichomonas vaginalis G3]|uniref:Beige/BEACH domain containing protein n=1 Tax=Trichomonas vaginalis (strain ATCC PRA-98 / G3) TaxID=412133 RepID=A2FGT2_TRIV3|nr:beige/BEACH-related family [Trichomonas vaginalis G3]EAX95876.1 Beige/BEACH domain containing protein [Trichomonas vaginalis G3]KAI5528797.1 beige/BEACH-related family [Trichomonas vaginalis G3]|eukprot:XP_001308806.1 Beige/BEACH domain containing protein [Trichomonas vaginalis G3]